MGISKINLVYFTNPKIKDFRIWQKIKEFFNLTPELKLGENTEESKEDEQK